MHIIGRGRGRYAKESYPQSSVAQGLLADALANWTTNRETDGGGQTFTAANS